MTIEITTADVVEFVKGLSESKIVDVWNEYCDANDYNEDCIESMYSFDELNYNKSPLEILNCVSDDFNTNHHYFVVSSSTGYFESFDYMEDANSPVDFEGLAEWLETTEHAIYLDCKDELEDIEGDDSESEDWEDEDDI